MMRERPILFSGPMIRAILAGTKTQTRRIYKPRAPAPYELVDELDDGKMWPQYMDEAGQYHAIHCRFGTPGSLLWVRETWKAVERESDGVDGIMFAADNTFVPIENTREAADRWIAARKDNVGQDKTWRPSIFLPRWASRISLVVTDIRVERLQAIGEEDARAEGVEEMPRAEPPFQEIKRYRVYGKGGEGLACPYGARVSYSTLWDSINGPGSWEANPWVWVVAFQVAP